MSGRYDGSGELALGVRFPLGAASPVRSSVSCRTGSASAPGHHPGVVGKLHPMIEELNYVAIVAAAAAAVVVSFGYYLSLIHISEPTRRTPISYAVFCL